jgi:hypothetical protein
MLMDIPYGIILPIAVGCLLYRYVASPDNSYYSKKILVVLAIGAFLVARLGIAGEISSSLVLMVIGIYLIVHRDLKSST